MSKKDEIKKKIERFNRKKIMDMLDELTGTITGRSLELKRFTGKTAPNGHYTYNEKCTRKFIDEIINYILHYYSIEFWRISGFYEILKKDVEHPADDPYMKEKFLRDLPVEDYKGVLPEGTDESEIIFFKSLLYCCIRIALYEDKKNEDSGSDFKPAALSTILESFKSLEFVYHFLMYQAYEAGFEDGGQVKYPRDYILMHTYDRRYSTQTEVVNHYNLELRSIFDKINLYYFHLTKGRIPAACDLEGYKETDPVHFRLLKKREDKLKKERDEAKENWNKYEEEQLSLLSEEEKEDLDIQEAANEYMDNITAGNYDENDENAVKLRESLEQNAEALPFEFNYDLTPDFESFSDFEEPESFIKECELFRFYLNAPEGYPKYNEKIGYAIDKYASENDLCGFSDTDTSVYIYTMLSQAMDIVIEKREEK